MRVKQQKPSNEGYRPNRCRCVANITWTEVSIYGAQERALKELESRMMELLEAGPTPAQEELVYITYATLLGEIFVTTDAELRTYGFKA